MYKTLKKTIQILLCIVALPVACVQTNDNWQKVRYKKSTTEQYYAADCNKDGQTGEETGAVPALACRHMIC